MANRLHQVSTVADGYVWALGWLQSHSGWLLVLDNVEDPAAVAELLGTVQGHGRVIVTTRRDLGPVWSEFGLVPLRLLLLPGVVDAAMLTSPFFSARMPGMGAVIVKTLAEA